MTERKPVLEIEHLSVAYDSPRGPVQAVNDVSLAIYEEEIVGLVGESGSGKSTMAYAIMRLLKGVAYVTGGSIKINGKDVYGLSKQELRAFRWAEMAMVFQSAMSALNPVMTVEQQIADTIRSHQKNASSAEIRKRAEELLDLVRIDRKHLKSYPHQLSGGMKQRVVIAIAICLKPSLVIMDEPTTALDVVVQRSILDQIQEIQREVKFAILFISHDFSLVSELASRVAIMYAGRVVELAGSRRLRVAGEHHPYTEGLLRAIPRLTADDVVIEGIPGNPPNLVELPSGCAFHPRCAHATERCAVEEPRLQKTGQAEIACHLFQGREVPQHV
ncbi:ABC transporter ATP-binding protein [Ferroacidibacillus organovorans]|uniref:Dipeptide/oligopeptide/nickel ABC transporter ATP-binding protein n=1 Tax=Ferroacidibacillus organovorans TaxID=1765683 RepID=A0A162UPC6_9BACL|nr:ABC transporter ATP-binding protein [Ferroacidibacillus organovorans]KYP81927.1 dipeptide/oligopeptide/nickel ABC transporter ATP-binding protein [Ferroacidibacillus organovorans]OAG94902.1 dipeptide/oligopeptide/nickel ABC transporter ATP-binding protein [Ferroacidibacillus organovorans]OPG15020.1 dipeptide/oligopeptide/nickel ABC transporter ATP-binding protein [Ferroacidibacillus organovorans]